jgi:transposase
MEIRTLGIDLGKSVFHLVGVNSVDKVVVRKKCSREKLLHFTANLRVERIGTEAAQALTSLAGHSVRMAMMSG